MKKLISLAMIAMLGLAFFGIAQPTVAGNGDRDIPADCRAAAAAPGADVRFIADGENGGPGAQVIIGTSGPDIIDGGSGNDIICGGGGRDTIRGGSGNDRIFGNGGNDTLLGETGGDFIDGGGGTNTCDGGTGANTLVNCGGSQPQPSDASVEITQGSFNFETNQCVLTFTLLNGGSGDAVDIDVSTNQGFFEEFVSSSNPQTTNVLFEFERIESVVATLEGSGETLPVSFPSVTCEGLS